MTSPAPATPSDLVVAIDVGGTTMKCALVDKNGTILHSERHPTGRERGGAAVTAEVLDVAQRLTDKAGDAAKAIGVVVPGVVDSARGVAIYSGNLGWHDLPLRDLLAAHTRRPVVVDHDVRAGGRAEARLGAARGEADVLFVAVGTGIAGAQVIDGRAYDGAHGAAGELGHIVVRPGGPACACGARGCLEAVASAAAVERRYAEHLAALQPTTPTGNVTAADVAAAAAMGEPAAAHIWHETVHALADGLVTAITLLDPSVIVLGGGLAEAGDLLIEPLRAALTARLTFQREPRLLRAALGDLAGCLGAALLALDLLTGEPETVAVSDEEPTALDTWP